MISCRWIISHRCSWITVYVLCCNAQVNLIVIFMKCTCIVMHSLFCQLPNYNLFTQHVIYLYGETPLVNCGPQSILLHLYYHLLQSNVYFPQALLYFTANKHLFPHYTSNSLFSANRWDWQPHCKLGQSSWLCCMQVSCCCWRRGSHVNRAPTCFLAPCQSKLATTFRSGLFLLLVD
jgi:hypothetical protein